MVARWLRKVAKWNPRLDRRKSVQDVFEHVIYGVRLSRRIERRSGIQRRAGPPIPIVAPNPAWFSRSVPTNWQPPSQFDRWSPVEPGTRVARPGFVTMGIQWTDDVPGQGNSSVGKRTSSSA